MYTYTREQCVICSDKLNNCPKVKKRSLEEGGTHEEQALQAGHTFDHDDVRYR